MPGKGLSVVITRRLPAAVEARMAELFSVTLNESDTPFDRAALAAAMAEADVLVPTITDRIDAELIAGAGPRLTLIASYGAGVDHIDVAAARAAGVAVTNTPGAVTDATADIGMTLILMSARRAGLAEGMGWIGIRPSGSGWISIAPNGSRPGQAVGAAGASNARSTSFVIGISETEKPCMSSEVIIAAGPTIQRI